MDMTKSNVKAALGFTTDVELAAFFSTERGTVFHWKDDKPIPYHRQLEARILRPDLFGEPADLLKTA